MQVSPTVSVARFEQLQPADLFVLLGHSGPCYALKTAQPANGDRSEMVLLGPTFPHAIEESVVVPWDAATVVSYGQNYTLLLPTEPSAWFEEGNTRTPACLTISGSDVFICTNGAGRIGHFFQCFVNLRTGEIVENRLPGVCAFTRSWGIVAEGAGREPCSMLRYSGE